MPKRKASAVWNGTLKEGSGTIGVQSGLFAGAPYGFGTRFEEEPGTNPEELIGAAFAGCFSMALAAGLERAGTPAQRVETTATIELEKRDGGFRITEAHLQTRVAAAGLDQAQLQEAAEAARDGCPVSQALAGVEKSVEATLVS